MAFPASSIIQMGYQNPHATGKLLIPVHVVCNTPDDDLLRNIGANSAVEGRKWVGFEKPHDRVAVMCGGGPSLSDHIDDILRLKEDGGIVFAMNAVSRYLREFGISADYQVIADAKPETATLVDPEAHEHLFASQVDPSCFAAVPDARLWHFEFAGMECAFPEKRRKEGGYAIVGGGAAVGNAAMALAYVMGYRTFEVFGYDSSHRGDASHAYDQPMNRFMPTIDVQWGGKTYRSALAMKAQAERFQITGRALVKAGCKVSVHGDGLLPAMWNTPVSNISERNKYKLLWQFDSYREVSPGEEAVDTFLAIAKPNGLILDFGCGTGRAALELAKRGKDVLAIDFADNCRDDEAKGLPFLEWDLTEPLPVQGDFGICADVMEHIPPEDVAAVIDNIMAAGRNVFFQISTVRDVFGALIGTDLHLTVREHVWWFNMFTSAGYVVLWDEEGPGRSSFYVKSINQLQ